MDERTRKAQARSLNTKHEAVPPQKGVRKHEILPNHLQPRGPLGLARVYTRFTESLGQDLRYFDE